MAHSELSPKARAILDAASELFYSQGIHAVGVDTIAAHAGVTKKTLYERFGSKAELAASYLSERDAQWRDFLEARLTAAEPDPEAQLRAVFQASASWSAERGQRGCAMINAHAEISDPEHPAYAVLIHQKLWMRDVFASIAEAAQVPEAEQLARGIFIAHEGALATSGMGVVFEAFDAAQEIAITALRAGRSAESAET